jgi:uncharacterized protein YaaQ
MEAVKPQKNPKYSCVECDFSTSNKKDFNRHMTTRKHLASKEGSTVGVYGINEKQQIPQIINAVAHICSACNKRYASRGSMWKHKQKCIEPAIAVVEQSIIQPIIPKTDTSITNEMVLELIKQNKELQSALVEQSAAIMEQNTKLVEMSSKGSTHIKIGRAHV